jgi:hypothetical protein
MPTIKSVSDLRNYNVLKLLSELKKGEASVKKKSDWLSSAEVDKRLGL